MIHRLVLVATLACLPATARAQPLLRADPDGGAPVPASSLTETRGGLLWLGDDGSEVAIVADNLDRVQDYDEQAGPSGHFRMSRGPCWPWAAAEDLAPTCDHSNPWAKDFTIAWYRYGLAMSYAGGIEVNSSWLSIHSNNAACVPEFSCNHAGQLLVGDESDRGGWYFTAHDATPTSRGYVEAAPDTWGHGSHGDMRLIARAEDDEVAIYSGAYGAEQRVAGFTGTGALSCASVTAPVVTAGAVRISGWEWSEDAGGNLVAMRGGKVGLTVAPP